jgi:hypothetical protein
VLVVGVLDEQARARSVPPDASSDQLAADESDRDGRGQADVRVTGRKPERGEGGEDRDEGRPRSVHSRRMYPGCGCG